MAWVIEQLSEGAAMRAPEKRCSFAPTFDLDTQGVWIADGAVNERRPGVLSQGTYGAEVAVPLIIQVRAHHNLGATFFAPGRLSNATRSASGRSSPPGTRSGCTATPISILASCRALKKSWGSCGHCTSCASSMRSPAATVHDRGISATRSSTCGPNTDSCTPRT